jgi:hypothetical protein
MKEMYKRRADIHFDDSQNETSKPIISTMDKVLVNRFTFYENEVRWIAEARAITNRWGYNC